MIVLFFFSSRRRHTRWPRDWSSDVCSSDLPAADEHGPVRARGVPLDPEDLHGSPPDDARGRRRRRGPAGRPEGLTRTAAARGGPGERGSGARMTVSRRDLVRSLGVGVLGAGALSACGEGPLRGRRRTTTPPPTGAAPTEPDVPLVIGQIGAAYGRMGVFEEAIAVSIDEARIDVKDRKRTRLNASQVAI